MSQHIHIIGVCGTFMGGIARLALERGFTVSGSDKAFYPPMSEQLDQLGVELKSDFRAEHLEPRPDLVIVGNAVSRGNPEVEYLLNNSIPYLSGAQWLGENILQGRHVLAIAGTHGKTTTACLVSHMLEFAGRSPGFLIGGVPGNFGVSARVGQSDLFVVEADEYDTAFFDKRSKFVHYRPRTVILNNLEFDHADIFPDIAAIETQFHHLMRCVPAQGRVVYNADESALARVLKRGCWSESVGFGHSGEWQLDADGALLGPGLAATLPQGWVVDGVHNRLNALAAIAACAHVGVSPSESIASLPSFKPPRRRLELLGSARGVSVYDDFAHHPTAIEATLAALQSRHPGSRLIVALELRSNSMRSGAHTAQLPAALASANEVLIYQPQNEDSSDALAAIGSKVTLPCELVRIIASLVREGDCVVCMSNGSFDGLQRQILDALSRH